MAVSIFHNYSELHRELARFGRAAGARSLYVVVQKSIDTKRRSDGAQEENMYWGWSADHGILTKIDPSAVDELYRSASGGERANPGETPFVSVGHLSTSSPSVNRYVIVSRSNDGDTETAGDLASFVAALVDLVTNCEGNRSNTEQYVPSILNRYSVPLLYTVDRTVWYANDAAEKFGGSQVAGEFTGRPIDELVSSEDREMVAGHLRDVSTNEEGRFLNGVGIGFGSSKRATALCSIPVTVLGFRLIVSALLDREGGDRSGTRCDSRVINALERQQRRIGIELHDGLGQLLTAARIASYEIADAATESGLRESCLRLARLTDESMTLLRTITYQLSPPQLLKENSFREALEALVELAHQISEGYCSLECKGDIEIQDAERRTHAFRIVQEAVNNAIKHSRANYIHVSARRLPNERLVLEVTDDGIGFTEDRTRNSIGMESMRYRARLLGARLTVNSAPDRHTKVLCSMPLFPSSSSSASPTSEEKEIAR